MSFLIVMIVGMIGLAIVKSYGGCLAKLIGWGIVLIDILIFAAINGRL